ncbi:hypothetical protein AB0451_13635 [Streptomyces sp. NPDC052000]
MARLLDRHVVAAQLAAARQGATRSAPGPAPARRARAIAEALPERTVR